MPNESTQTLAVSGKLRSELAANLFARLREMSFDGIGISRETYGLSETAAMELVAKEAEVHGLETEWDAARNMIVRLPGQDRRLAAVAETSRSRHP